MATKAPVQKVEKSPEELAKGYEKLAIWNEKQEQLAALKVEENELRNEVVAFFFPAGLKEGTQKCELPEGWELSVDGKLNRKIDVQVEQQVKLEAKEKFGIDLGEGVKYKPELDLPFYRELQKQVGLMPEGPKREEATAILKLFESMLIVTPGTPQVKLIAPKRPKVKVQA